MPATGHPLPSYEPPSHSEVEINVFGPGVGECVLVHLGAGAWLVVDSCRGRGRARPAALEYLSAMGVPPSAIQLIVATHWHDDHVKGIAEVYEKATDASFYVAASVRPDEFRAITGAQAMGSRFTSGVDELSKVSRIAEARGVPVRAAAASQRIYHQADQPVAEVWALSPSYEDQSISRLHIASLLPAFQPGARRVPAQDPNDTSVVLLLETVQGGVLLGGDLEHPASRLRGWHAVMDLESAPTTRAGFFKVPHHGSSNAHCPEVWQHRVDDDVIAVLAPFDRGRSSLPRPSDRSRIRALTDRAYLTSDKRDRPVKRDNATEKTIREATRSFVPETLRMGHVQARGGGGAWSVAMSEEAVAV